jgi:hypothetical protein
MMVYDVPMNRSVSTEDSRGLTSYTPPCESWPKCRADILKGAWRSSHDFLTHKHQAPLRVNVGYVTHILRVQPFLYHSTPPISSKKRVGVAMWRASLLSKTWRYSAYGFPSGVLRICTCASYGSLLADVRKEHRGSVCARRCGAGFPKMEMF